MGIINNSRTFSNALILQNKSQPEDCMDEIRLIARTVIENDLWEDCISKDVGRI